MTPHLKPDDPRVSVITIFYNAELYLEEAIESVLAQDYREFELLLVDDGSTDASSAIAQQYAARDPGRVRYFHHPGRVNRGMSASRNLGTREARGEFIAFIDADDRWKPVKLREQIQIFDRLPELDAVFGSVNYWRSWCGGADRLVRTGHVQDAPVRPPEAACSLYPLGRAPAPCPSDLMVRRSTVKSIGGFEESFTGAMQMYEDQAFFAKLYLSGTVYFADRNWLDYRIHDQSCVAEVSRQGQYHAVRGQFLGWLSTYLDRTGRVIPPSIRGAIKRALLRNRLRQLVLGLRKLATGSRQLEG